LANRKFALEPRLLNLIGRLLLYPAIPRSRCALDLGSLTLPFFARMLFGPELDGLSFLGWGRIKPVPRGRSFGSRYTAGPQRAAICQAKSGNKKHNRLVNHAAHGLGIRNRKDFEEPGTNSDVPARKISKAEQREPDPAKCKN
jgi:hypothetical protein